MGLITKIKNYFSKVKKLFNENEMFLTAEAKLLEVLAEKKEDLKEIVDNKVDAYTPILKEKLGDIIVNKLELNFPLNLFRKTIKKTVLKNYDKLITFLKEQLK